MLKDKKSIITVSVISLILLLALIGYFSTHKKCSASDFKARAPVKTTGSGFTQDAACKKAVATCSLYSTWPQDCKIVK